MKFIGTMIVAKILSAGLAMALVVANASTSPAPKAEWDPFRGQPADAQFRWYGREMYKSLEMPSCRQLGVPSGFNRDLLLKAEQQRVAALEAQTKDSGTQAWLEIARDDARFEMMANSSCWNDSDMVIATRHIDMTKREVATSINRMEQLASSLPSMSSPYASLPVDAEFRHRVRWLIKSAWLRCSLSEKIDNDELAAPAQAVVRSFREGLEGTRFAAQYDVAKGDVDLEYAVTQVECDDPDNKPRLYWQKQLSDGVSGQIKTLRTLIVSGPTKAAQTYKP